MEANGNSCSKTAKCHPFFQEFLRMGCQLWTQISQLLLGQIEKFLCLSDREFPEFFKKHPTFVPSHFQSGVISKMPRTCVFLGHPVCEWKNHCIHTGHSMMTSNASSCTSADSCLLQTCEFGETSCFWTVDKNVRKKFSIYL